MTSTSDLTRLATADDDRIQARRAVIPVGVAATLAACALSVLRSDSVQEFAVVVPVAALAAALLYGVVVPRALRGESAGARALGLGVAALVLALPAFWSGVPLLLGSSAALLGYAGKRASSGSGKSAAGLVLGLLAVLAIVVIYSADWVAHPAASWWQH